MVLQYTALGDSLTAGVGAMLFAPGFVHRYKRMAEEDFKERVLVDVFAKPGLETKDILAMLDDGRIIKSIEQAEIITITAGGNDVIHAVEKFQGNDQEDYFMETLEQSQENYTKIIDKIYEIKGKENPEYIIRMINLYNPFPDIPMADKWIMTYNQHLQSLSGAPHVEIADVYEAFKGHEREYLSFDHIHPNNNGYQAIAESLRKLGYDPLRN